MTPTSRLQRFWTWMLEYLRYDPVHDHLAQSVDRADYVARFKNLRYKGLL